eukprot:IDg3141t1
MGEQYWQPRAVDHQMCPKFFLMSNRLYEDRATIPTYAAPLATGPSRSPLQKSSRLNLDVQRSVVDLLPVTIAW